MLSIRALLLLLTAGALAAAVPSQDVIPGWLEELKRKTDDAEVALVGKLADTRTREAALGLIQVYDLMKSVYMQREIVRALPRFSGVADAEQPAMEKLANIAANTEELELREAAIAGLGQAGAMGHTFLRRLVESEVADPVREQAMRAHVRGATPEDAAWYRHVWNPQRERRKNADGVVLGPEYPALRQLAFGALARELGEDELVETVRTELDPKIRRAALLAMNDRNLGRTAEMAAWMTERVDLPGADRIVAARILVQREGPKAAPLFLELAKKRDVTTEDLRQELARLLVGMKDDATNKRIARLIGRGKTHEQVFALQAAAGIDDPKVLAAIRKELQDREPDVRKAAAEVLGQRRDRDALPDLRALLQKPKLPQDVRVAIEAIGQIEGRSPRWLAELTGLAGHADRDVRNAALEQLAADRDEKHLPVLLTSLSHADWTTRQAAIDGLVLLRDKAAVPKLIDRLEHEQGRMGRAVADALWQLTGQSFEEDVSRWRAWWAAEGPAFQVISKADLEKVAKERELKRLRQRTRSGAKFFGIRIESHRVIFIIDCSGSMLESVYGRMVGKRGAARIDVAKEELSQCIRNLEQGALFNIFAFSNGVERWQKAGIGDASEQSREAALTWVDRLGASGGTNLFDSVQQAFADQDVDTIFILSDGEPTAGALVDPHRIREQVQFWNKHRGIVIHTIAIGTDLEVLQWLSGDSGGRHVFIR